jgi:hypothetical protein
MKKETFDDVRHQVGLLAVEGDRTSGFAQSGNYLLLVGQELVVHHRLRVILEQIGAADDVELADVRR